MNKKLKYQYYLLLIPGAFPFILCISMLYYKKYLKRHKIRSLFKIILNGLIVWVLFYILPDIIYNGSIDYIVDNTLLFIIFLYVMNFTAGIYQIREEKKILEKYS
jgi:H+/Cl- antiporter ClcA